ncbi:hypothetical protein Goarm_011217 [Gossypium armourianum]|uniref:Uncharacterized protein n=1 Tax=Gossypium armourianum TaxID=34283 RepID=A0A7J9IW90_9ROSI|nr:hypothetical protein [Gossypium armourianum]MBA0826358.1 hypothetical protein [Gossypium armourianum]
MFWPGTPIDTLVRSTNTIKMLPIP